MHTKTIGDVTIHHNGDWSEYVSVEFPDAAFPGKFQAVVIPGHVALALGFAAFGREMHDAITCIDLEGIADRHYRAILDRIIRMEKSK